MFVPRARNQSFVAGLSVGDEAITILLDPTAIELSHHA